MSTNTELIKAIKDHFYGRVVDLVESGLMLIYAPKAYHHFRGHLKMITQK